jgi:hypothetical protein
MTNSSRITERQRLTRGLRSWRYFRFRKQGLVRHWKFVIYTGSRDAANQ